MSPAVTRASIVLSLAAVLAASVAGSAAAMGPIGAQQRAPRQAASRVVDASYGSTIDAGRTMARSTLEATGASSLSLALVADGRVVWHEGFGSTDPATGALPTDTTLYGIGSVSKMFATIAVMQLVDAGLVSLEMPVTTYIPDFRMASPEYRAITVRMLLDHSAGLPGTDYRNGMSSAPYAGYPEQVLAALATERLKTTPGSMSVYCNDCFTLAQVLVAHVSGITYERYVADEILAPLGMTHSRYLTEVVAPGTAAPVITDGVAAPQEYINIPGSGGLFSTPLDMANLALMLMDGGMFEGQRVLSADAIAEMGTDQTTGSLSVEALEAFRYGLGWDTVSEPGLAAVGVRAWLKGGDTTDYHAGFIVAPDAHLAVIVEGVGPTFSSTAAESLGQAILLHALIDQGARTAMPDPVTMPTAAGRAPTAAELDAITGTYGASGSLFRVSARPDGLLAFAHFAGTDWVTVPGTFTLGADGAFWTDAEGGKSIRPVEAWGRRYLVLRAPAGSGHYRTDLALGQLLAPSAPLSPAWTARLTGTWVITDEIASSLAWAAPVARLVAVPGLPGSLAVATDGSVIPVDAGTSDTFAAMTLVIPTAQGRDLSDLTVVERDGAEWLLDGPRVLEPVSAMVQLGSAPVIIGPEGWATWRTVRKTSSLSTEGASAWKVYDADLAPVGAGDGDAVTVSVPAGGHVALFGPAGAHIGVDLMSASATR
jgi:CubicO group peptidase (beta-lactamase class C family)